MPLPARPITEQEAIALLRALLAHCTCRRSRWGGLAICPPHRLLVEDAAFVERIVAVRRRVRSLRLAASPLA